MAITVNQIPDLVSPIFQNTLPIVVISNLATANNFQYVFDTYILDQFSFNPTFISRVPAFPQPNANGVYSPHYILRDQTSFQYQPYIVQQLSNNSAYVLYQVNVGEQFNPSLTWSSTSNVAGSLQLTLPATHSLVAGAVIRLDKTDKSVNVSYDGTCSIVSVTALTILTSKAFGVAVSNESGLITNYLRFGGTGSGILQGYNGTAQYLDYNKDFGLSYSFSGNGLKPFLTDYSEKNFITYEWDTLSYIKSMTYSVDAEPTRVAYIGYGYDNNYQPLGTGSLSLTASGFSNLRRMDIPTGLKNLFNSSGIFATIFNAIALASSYKYTVQVFGGTAGNTPLSIPFTYYNNTPLLASTATPSVVSPSFTDGCRDYPLIEIMYMNKYGAMEFFMFSLISRTNRKVDRSKYKKVLPYNYTPGNRGTTIFDEQVTEEMILNSDWLSDSESLRLRDLIESPEVYIVMVRDNIIPSFFEQPEQNVTIPIIVTNDNYEVKNSKNDQLFNFTLTIEKAFPIWINI